LRSTLGFFSVFALVVAGLLLIVKFLAPSWLHSENEQARLVYLLLFLVLIGGGAFGAGKAQIGVAIRQAIIWLAIFLLVIVVYSFRQELGTITTRVQSELQPSQPIAVQQNSAAVAIGKSDDGQFHAQGRVNGTHVRFLVDTGASSIALTLNDAKRAKIDISKLSFTVPVNTAAGQTFGAYVTLDKVSVGQITLRNVEAFVLQEGLDISLLGMSFLGRLQKFEASRSQLILTK